MARKRTRKDRAYSVRLHAGEVESLDRFRSRMETRMRQRDPSVRLTISDAFGIAVDTAERVTRGDLVTLYRETLTDTVAEAHHQVLSEALREQATSIGDALAQPPHNLQANLIPTMPQRQRQAWANLIAELGTEGDPTQAEVQK